MSPDIFSVQTPECLRYCFGIRGDKLGNSQLKSLSKLKKGQKVKLK